MMATIPVSSSIRSNRRRTILFAGAALAAATLMLRPLIRLISPRPASLGVTNGLLAACPHSPNCVCSQAPAQDVTHAIAPLSFEGDPAAAFARLRNVVVKLSGAKLITSRDDYLHFEFVTPLMGFIDDVEFLLDAAGRTIHFRSASRLGYSDLGANRKRIESIRSAFGQAVSE